ncbi:hypothetical protein FB567DRAFT_630826 [Paraphoma chrysanthemicola]|uniref:RRM domain-containing protein n=1 Tax=Paraphoma chrysanthemicola TaxID=798071 RepID=A0A8K0R3P9_9PLEO|nr:hypothetical protein FB567DRAFT_630826 [Paraphoma chrysanthemicola]
MATVMYLDHLPVNTESSFVATMFTHDLLEKIKEIYTYIGGSTCAWVVFEAVEDAKKAVNYYDRSSFGPATSSKYDLENQIESCTVEILNLPETHTGRNLNQLLEPVREEFDMYVPSGDPYFDYEPDDIVRARTKQEGIALVQLANPHMAKNVVHRFAGTYWKNATLNARCVPDEEMEDLLVPSRSNSMEKDVMLFVLGIKPGTSRTEVSEIFKDHRINDIIIPPGGKRFCFIFARQNDANAIIARSGPGVFHEGKPIRVKLADKSKKKGTAPVPHIIPAPIKPGPGYETIDLKVNNLPYGVAESTLRIVFQDFRVAKVVLKEGYAFIGIASEEVERAIATLKGRKVGDRVMAIKVSERRK